MPRYPQAKAHNWLIYHVVVPQLEQRLRQYAQGTLLDIGCGEKPYHPVVAPLVAQHIGIDHPQTGHATRAIDAFSNAYHIPLQSATVGTVLCTYVLEHLEEPGQALAEAYRVLRPGGYAIYTVPLFWHLHEEPRDFYRYTRHGLHYLFTQSGYEVVEIVPVSGFVVTFVQELVYVLHRFRRGGWLAPLGWMVVLIGHVLQALAYLLNRVDRSHRFTVEYIAVGRKPE